MSGNAPLPLASLCLYFSPLPADEKPNGVTAERDISSATTATAPLSFPLCPFTVINQDIKGNGLHHVSLILYHCMCYLSRVLTTFFRLYHLASRRSGLMQSCLVCQLYCRTNVKWTYRSSCLLDVSCLRMKWDFFQPRVVHNCSVFFFTFC